MPLSLAEWRKERKEVRDAERQGVEQVLLSGLPVRMRPVDPLALLRGGRVPDILTPLVFKALYAFPREDVDSFVFDQRKEIEETERMLESVNLVCEAALIYPKIVAEPNGDGEIALEELSIADRMWIFRMAFMPAELLTRFRYEPAGDVETVADEQSDPQQAEPATEHQG